VADFSLDDVIRIKSEVEGELLAKPGVTGVDVGQRPAGGSPVIRVYVASRDQIPADLGSMTEIRGVPVEIIERRFELH
jgi:hypothetical protein